MKKFGIAACVLSGIAVISGLTVAEIGEYAVVGRETVKVAIKDAVPTDVELKRFEVLLAKIEGKTQDQKRVVARAQIELKRSEEQLEAAIAMCDSIKKEMVLLRDKPEVFVSTCGTKISTGSSQKLGILLGSYKTHAKTLAAREKAVTAQRDAVAKLTTRFQEWGMQRDALRQEFESLKARQSATQIANASDTRFVDSDLQRALQLRDELEARIGVEEKIDEDITVGVWSETELTGASIEQQVDLLLGVSDKNS